MELDELKKSWNLFDEELKGKELISEEEISKLIGKADKGIKEMVKFNVKVIILGIVIILLMFLMFIYDKKVQPIYIFLFVIAIPAFFWDLRTTRYLQQTNLDEMPIIVVIQRINLVQKWLIFGQLIGFGIFFIAIIFSFIQHHIWQQSIGLVLSFFIIWGISLAVVIWIYRNKYMKRIKDIKKNLDELNMTDRD